MSDLGTWTEKSGSFQQKWCLLPSLLTNAVAIAKKNTMQYNYKHTSTKIILGLTNIS